MYSEEASKKTAGEAPAKTSNPNPSQRRGNYRGKHFYHNYHQTGKRKQNQQAPQVRKVSTGTPAKKFSGRIDDLKGHIYDVGYGQQADAFVKKTEEIAGYAGRTCKQSTDIRAAIEKLQDVTITLQARVTIEEVPDKDDRKIIRKSQIDEYRKRNATYQENKGKIYPVIIGQCTDAMIEKLKGDPNFDMTEHNSDMLGILGMIKKVVFKVETQQYLFQSLHVALRRFYTTYQRDGTTMEQYYVHFMNQRDVVEQCGGNLSDHKSLMTLSGQETARNDGCRNCSQQAQSKEGG